MVDPCGIVGRKLPGYDGITHVLDEMNTWGTMTYRVIFDVWPGSDRLALAAPLARVAAYEHGVEFLDHQVERSVWLPPFP